LLRNGSGIELQRQALPIAESPRGIRRDGKPIIAAQGEAICLNYAPSPVHLLVQSNQLRQADCGLDVSQAVVVAGDWILVPGRSAAWDARVAVLPQQAHVLVH